jgi:CRISPR-associated protein (TIGR02584 family)
VTEDNPKVTARDDVERAAKEPVVAVAAIGPYTAPIAALIWALYRQRGLRVVEAHVVVDRRGLRYVDADLLNPNQILDQMRRALDDEIVKREDFHVRPAILPSGDPIGDLSRPENVACFREALWKAARDAIASAGERRVVFGLASGLHRAATALASAFFQLLARERDLLVDVRIEDARIDSDTEFFFPEQEQQELAADHAVIDARSVPIVLTDVELPRLAGVLEGSVLTDFDSAVRVAKSRAASEPPPLVIDLVQGAVTVDGLEVELSIAERFWYAYLAWRRGQSNDGWVLAGQEGHAGFLEFLEATRARAWSRSIRTRPLRFLLEGEFVHDEDLRNLRGKTVQRLKRWCARHRPELARLIVPEADGNGHQRLPLPANRIRVIGGPPRLDGPHEAG